MSNSDYIGRFAPSPTGPLHFGSLIAATASYADALHHCGQWRLRMEDVDEARTVAGADAAILRSLETYGFEWQGSVPYQSQRKNHYAAIINELLEKHEAYPCSCTRKQIMATAPSGREGYIYPGTCRQRELSPSKVKAIRLTVPDQLCCFEDRIQGRQCQNLATEVGDFLIRRGDGYTAYQLAVVIDDAEQGVNQVVRGADLLFSTPRQIYLQQRLGLPTPGYAHVPLVVDDHGRKLSKQARAAEIDKQPPVTTLLQAWQFLGQEAPCEPPSSPAEFWNWAGQAWNLALVPTRIAIQVF